MQLIWFSMPKGFKMKLVYHRSFQTKENIFFAMTPQNVKQNEAID